MNSTPIPYDASVETVAADEAQTAAEIDETMTSIREKTFADGRHAIRSVHAKSHGLLRADVVVEAGLAPELAQGMFAAPGRYPAVLRFSTTPGDIVDDDVSTPRGVGLKIVGVAGERLPGSVGDVTQDFVLVNGKTFNAASAKKFLASLKPLAASTDKAEGAKKAVSTAMQLAEGLLEAFGGKSAKLVSMGGQPETQLLGESFFSQAPLRWGLYMGKVALVPRSPELLALKDVKLDLKGRPNALREEVVEFFSRHGAEWELCVQLCTDLEKMPIEDPSVEWPEDVSPYRRVGRVVALPQLAWSAARAGAIDDGMMFSPWHGLAAHRPLGGVMRARQTAYEMSARFRAQKNEHPIREPRELDSLPS